jgi:hypothetical protein
MLTSSCTVLLFYKIPLDKLLLKDILGINSFYTFFVIQVDCLAYNYYIVTYIFNFLEECELIL